jgi:hypothetical protein
MIAIQMYKDKRMERDWWREVDGEREMDGDEPMERSANKKGIADYFVLPKMFSIRHIFLILLVFISF